MRRYGIPIFAIVFGVIIGLLIATPRTPAAVEAPPEVSVAAIPGEKGGSDLFGAYEVVPDWPKPLSQLEGHENWTWGSAEGIFAESPDRVFGFQRGELPVIETPESRPIPGFPRGVSFPMNLGGGVPPYLRNASGASPGGGEYRGELGVDARKEHNIVVFDREGNFIEDEVWKQWDSMFRRPHAVHINPYDAEKHVWFVDDAAHAVYRFSNDGSTLVQTLGTPYESGDDETHFNRPTYLGWLPDSTLFVGSVPTTSSSQGVTCSAGSCLAPMRPAGCRATT